METPEVDRILEDLKDDHTFDGHHGSDHKDIDQSIGTSSGHGKHEVCQKLRTDDRNIDRNQDQ